MRVELLWWEGCPSYPEAADLLRSVIAERGIAVEIETRQVLTAEQAAELGFSGSPTILIDGRDIDPSGAGSRPSLSCRIYQLEDGRTSPVPSRAQLQAAFDGASRQNPSLRSTAP